METKIPQLGPDANFEAFIPPFSGKSLEALFEMIETQKERIRIEEDLEEKFMGFYSYEDGKNPDNGEELENALQALKENNSCAHIKKFPKGSVIIEFRKIEFRKLELETFIETFIGHPTYTALDAKEKIAEIEKYIAFKFPRSERLATRFRFLCRSVLKAVNPRAPKPEIVSEPEEKKKDFKKIDGVPVNDDGATIH